MRRKPHTEPQIVFALQQAGGGAPVADAQEKSRFGGNTTRRSGRTARSGIRRRRTSHALPGDVLFGVCRVAPRVQASLIGGRWFALFGGAGSPEMSQETQ